jgi:signal transduction histidine kinase
MHFPPGDTTFQGDPALLEQVLINLVKNAMDAVEKRDNPQISIQVLKQTNGKMNIQVVDNGCGIEQEELEQIFVPFYTTKDHGSGIGLSLSRQIMRLHKGNIEVQSVVGEGTVVRLTL